MVICTCCTSLVLLVIRDAVENLLYSLLGGLTMETEASGEMLAQMGIPEGADPVEAIAQMPEDARAQMTESMGEKFRDMPDSMITQAAVSYVQAEYEALGEDVDGLQMKYIGKAGLKMILMALLIMAASISVVFQVFH